MNKLKVAVLISGRGTNMAALARATIDPDYPAEIVLVLSNRPHVAGLDIAMDNNIPVRVIDHKEYEDRETHEEAVSQALREARADMICLAGYMRLLSDRFLGQWRGQIINIHPSLLPAFRGVDTHERALERGVRIHGCTVHFVTSEMDEGPIIAQAAVPVLPNDDAEALSARVLEMEHRLYPHALALIANQKIRWSGDDAVANIDVSVDDIAFMPQPPEREA